MHRIWAVAINTVRQALRMRIAVIFTILLLVLLPLMGRSMTGDGTVKGQCQTFVSYGLSLTSMLLCLLTIIISVYVLSNDIKQRQIYTVITKPIRRYELVLGKLMGIIILDFMLLIFFGGIIYGITVYMPIHYGVTGEARTALDNEFFTARASLMPVEPDVTEETEQVYEKLKKSGQLPENALREKVMEWLEQQKKLEKRAAGPGEPIKWEFHNVRPMDSNDSLFVRFKFEAAAAPEDSEIYGRWIVGDYSAIAYGMQAQTEIFDEVHRYSVGTFHELKVPSYVVPADGHLAVAFVNAPANNTSVIFQLDDGMELLYEADTFTANFVRAGLMIFIRLIFLACLGVLASTFLSFPVAIMFCLVIFFVATFSGFVVDSFNYLGEGVGGVYTYTVTPLIKLLPQFDKFNPTKFLVPGRLIGWSLLARAAGLIVCIKGPILLLLGLLIFSRRELARITV